MNFKILIIEDDFTIQTQLKNLLTGNGYPAEAVTDFSNVIEYVKTFQPHLVLLDIKLPGNDGFSICSQIRTFSHMPIIFVTSSNTDMDELNSIMLGGDALGAKYTEAQNKATQRYMKNAYDDVKTRVPKGTKDIWKEEAKKGINP